MSWVLRRIGVACVLVWVVASIVFLAIRFTPGDPAQLLLSQGGLAPTPAQVTALRAELGLNLPMAVQYVRDFGQLLHGNLGKSLQDGSSVSAEIMLRLPRTLELIAAAAVIALFFGLPAGLIAALRSGRIFDRIMSWVAAAGLSVPVFVIGTVLVLVFGQMLQWVPVGGYASLGEHPGQNLALVAMPAATLACGLFSVVFRMTRAAVLDVFLSDYVRTAHAKGIARPRILRRHVLRNALSPVVTVVGLQLGGLVGGTVLVEFVFNYPGLSSMLITAVTARDYPEIQGVVLVISVVFVTLNLIVDLLYAVLDPRVRRA